MGQDDDIRNPVEEYMRYIMDRDKPEKSPETTSKPAKHLEVRQASDSAAGNDEALKVADAIKQSVKIKNSSRQNTDITNDSEEGPVFDVRRHPFGLAVIFLAVIVGWAAAFSLISFLLPGISDLLGFGSDIVGMIAGICMLAATFLVFLFLFFTAKGYLASRLVLTDFNLAYDLPTGLRSHRTGELPLDEIRDIKVHKPGILARIFDFGTLTIEMSKGKGGFSFDYSPAPEAYAKSIQDSRLRYLAYYKIFNL